MTVSAEPDHGGTGVEDSLAASTHPLYVAGATLTTIGRALFVAGLVVALLVIAASVAKVLGGFTGGASLFAFALTAVAVVTTGGGLLTGGERMCRTAVRSHLASSPRE